MRHTRYDLTLRQAPDCVFLINFFTRHLVLVFAIKFHVCKSQGFYSPGCNSPWLLWAVVLMFFFFLLAWQGGFVRVRVFALTSTLFSSLLLWDLSMWILGRLQWQETATSTGIDHHSRPFEIRCSAWLLSQTPLALHNQKPHGIIDGWGWFLVIARTIPASFRDGDLRRILSKQQVVEIRSNNQPVEFLSIVS